MNSNLEINQTKELAITDKVNTAGNVEKTGEEIYICDECGDTMWDAVLAQQDSASKLNNVPGDVVKE